MIGPNCGGLQQLVRAAPAEVAACSLSGLCCRSCLLLERVAVVLTLIPVYPYD